MEGTPACPTTGETVLLSIGSPLESGGGRQGQEPLAPLLLSRVLKARGGTVWWDQPIGINAGG